MNFFILLYSLLLSVFSISASAYTLNMKLKGNNVVYNNAIALGGDEYALTDWTAINNLIPTNRWQPALLTTNNRQFILTGPGGDVIVPIHLLGGQFNIGGVSGVSDQNAPIISGSICGDRSGFDGSVVTLSSVVQDNVGHVTESCQAGFSLSTLQSVQPFYFNRPIFSINSQELIAAFEVLDKKIPGQYFGSISVNNRYYFLENGVVTYRQLPSQSFTVQINYSPEFITDINVDTQKNIVPVYDTSLHMASGSVDFNVKATGYFQTGIQMTFDPKKEYFLNKVKNVPDDISLGSKPIPYFIRCGECSTSSIVENGAIQNLAVSPVKYEVSSPTEMFEFNLTVGYEGISSEDIETGTYMDTFTVIFEEIM
ncbi:hypothetical protein [Shewanella vaxholmensis]